MADQQFIREEEILLQQYNEGGLSLVEYNARMRDLQRDYRAMSEEAAQDAYEREIERW